MLCHCANFVKGSNGCGTERAESAECERRDEEEIGVLVGRHVRLSLDGVPSGLAEGLCFDGEEGRSSASVLI